MRTPFTQRIFGFAIVGLCWATWQDARADAQQAPATPVEQIQERYSNGQISVERHVTRDANDNFINHGLWTAYRPDGNKIGSGEYGFGKRQGVWSRWFAPGESPLLAGPAYEGHQGPYFSEGTYVDSELHGPWIFYDANKQKMSHWEFDQGQQHGVWTWWYPNGQKQREMFFDHATPIGDVTHWSPDGKVVEQFSYVAGRRKVWKEAAHYNGQKHWGGWYLEPEEVTKSVYDWWQGSASTEVVRVLGERQRHGEWTWWHPNGQTHTKGRYAFGQFEGPWIWWHPNGQKWVEGLYVQGEKAGAWITWDPVGTVINRQQFAAVDVVEPAQPARPATPEVVSPATPAPSAPAIPTPSVAGSTLTPEQVKIIKPRPNRPTFTPTPSPAIGGGGISP